MITETGANSDSQEVALLYDLWKLLNGEESEEVALKDVQTVVIAVLRMVDGHKRIGVPAKQTQQEKEDPRHFGFYNEKQQFCLRAEDVAKLQKHFNVFYLNRLQHIGKLLELQKAQKASISEFQYKP